MSVVAAADAAGIALGLDNVSDAAAALPRIDRCEKPVVQTVAHGLG
jgi:hypothetical protein